uniref:Uncharacterized protein n=1 Tax=Setaria italica TaxID=4555 RepID=K3Z147_SETIT
MSRMQSSRGGGGSTLYTLVELHVIHAINLLFAGQRRRCLGVSSL